MIVTVVSVQFVSNYSGRCLQVPFFLHEQQQPTMHLKYAEVLVIVLHQNMKLGDNTQNNERPS